MRPAPEERLEKARRLEDLELEVDNPVALDNDIQRTLPLDPGELSTWKVRRSVWCISTSRRPEGRRIGVEGTQHPDPDRPRHAEVRPPAFQRRAIHGFRGSEASVHPRL